LITLHGVDFLLGGYGSTQVGKEAIIANQHGIPYVNGGGATSSIYTETEWAFGLLSPIRKLAETTMAFLDVAVQGMHVLCMYIESYIIPIIKC